MNKRTISLLTAAAISVSGAAVLTASAETTVNVVVNGSKVDYADQQAVIENDRTLIPVRGAFEAMGAKVEWDGETRTVTVKDEHNTHYAFLTIGSDIMETHTYKSLFDVEKKEVKLDVPAQIMNDRTMIPLRAVGEALGAEVSWDGETYTATITSKTVSEEKKASLAALSLAAEETDNDDEATLLVNISNLKNYSDSYVSGITLGLNYDPSALELSGYEFWGEDGPVEDSISADDDNNGSLKIACITINEEQSRKTDGTILKVHFKKLGTEATDVSMANTYTPGVGYSTYVIISKGETDKGVSGTDLIIDTSEFEIK